MIRFQPCLEERAAGGPQLSAPVPPVEILLPVHNEWHVLRPCLESLHAFTSYPDASVTVLDDGSDEFVRERIEEAAARRDALPVRVLRNPRALGFVKNANRGFRESRAPLLVLLNSDTVVTPGWLERLVDAALSDPSVACVMPMSNQCSFHSLEIPMGWNAFQYSADLARRVKRTCFDAVTAGGFCLLVKREALDDVGLYDEAFGRGYGEESDWCMRARSRGWKVVGAEDVFVYHRGKVSFKDYKQETFKKGNYRRFMERWGEEYSRAMAEYHERDALAPLRARYVRMDTPAAPPVLSAFVDRWKCGGPAYATAEAARYIRDQGGVGRVPSLVVNRGLVRPRHSKHPMPRGFQSRQRPRVTYVLEKFAVSGGVLSVVQLVNRLTLLGWDAKIATHHDHDQGFLSHYMLYHQPYVFPSAEDLVENFPESDVVVATLWSTASKVAAAIRRRLPNAVPWYFIQDDETRFFEEADREGRQAVLDSYGLIPNKIVKSRWLADLLRERGHEAHQVPLGMDLDLFYPSTPLENRPLRIVGMTRPRTPRRGFEALVAAMREVKARRPYAEVCFFGCENLSSYDIGFEHTDLGVVPHERLRSLYGESAILVDTSEFQGLGRMGLEAMACGCAAVLTRFGGIDEYARDGVNCLSIDPSDPHQTVDAVMRLIDDRELRVRLARAGLETAVRFSADAEATATSALFAANLATRNVEELLGGARDGDRPRERGPTTAAGSATATAR